MSKNHPHHDIIVAYLEGKTVQCLRYDVEGDGIWVDVATCDNNGGTMPAFHTRSTYRIKPIVKPNVVQQYKVELKAIGTTRHEVVVRRPEHWETEDLELVFDGNTNQLVSAKVLK
jgi:hypothetical protein